MNESAVASEKTKNNLRFAKQKNNKYFAMPIGILSKFWPLSYLCYMENIVHGMYATLRLIH